MDVNHGTEGLDNYRPRTEPNITNRRKILENATYFYEGRQMINGDNGGNSGNNGNNGDNGNLQENNNKSQTRSSKFKKKIMPTSNSNTIYKYFFEKSVTDIENKLRNYKKNPKTKKII